MKGSVSFDPNNVKFTQNIREELAEKSVKMGLVLLNCTENPRNRGKIFP